MVCPLFQKEMKIWGTWTNTKGRWPKFAAEDEEDSMIMTWLWNSIQPEISKNIYVSMRVGDSEIWVYSNKVKMLLRYTSLRPRFIPQIKVLYL